MDNDDRNSLVESVGRMKTIIWAMSLIIIVIIGVQTIGFQIQSLVDSQKLTQVEIIKILASRLGADEIQHSDISNEKGASLAKSWQGVNFFYEVDSPLIVNIEVAVNSSEGLQTFIYKLPTFEKFPSFDTWPNFNLSAFASKSNPIIDWDPAHLRIFPINEFQQLANFAMVSNGLDGDKIRFEKIFFHNKTSIILCGSVMLNQSSGKLFGQLSGQKIGQKIGPYSGSYSGPSPDQQLKVRISFVLENYKWKVKKLEKVDEHDKLCLS